MRRVSEPFLAIMSSIRKAAANKLNASRSTGPRTPGGKLRSSRNSFRHGLATPVTHDLMAAYGIDRLARALAENSNDYLRLEKARVVAESHFDLARIRAARTTVLARNGEGESFSTRDAVLVVSALEKIARYELRTRSKLRKGVKDLIKTD